MTKGFFLSLATLACLLTANAFGNDGVPNANVLDQMGLSGLQVMSDSDATAIRGKGYCHPWQPRSNASVWGSSYADIGGGILVGAHSDNSYGASGARSAEGWNTSMADVTLGKVKTYKLGCRSYVKSCVTTLTFSAGGASFARAR